MDIVKEAGEITVIVHPAPEIDWVWYGEDEDGGKHLSFGRYPKLACQRRFVVDGPELRNLVTTASVLQTSVGNMRVPQDKAEAGLQVSVTIGPALLQARECLAKFRRKFSGF